MRRFQASSKPSSRSWSARVSLSLPSSLRAAVFVFAGTSILAFAQGPIGSVQQSLKDQQFYFGEVNGKLDDETRAALRRFQIHEGLPVSGEMDSGTLEALQSKPGTAEVAPPSGAAAPERSVRGRAQSMAKSDREFLDQLEEPGEATPPARSSSAPPPPAPAPEPRRVEREERSTPPPPPVAERRERSRQESVERREPAPEAPENERQGITEGEARRFVEGYLSAAEGPTPEGEVSFYADRVDYFDSGKVNRSFIEKDQRNYYRRWPSRDFELVGEPQVLRASEDNATIRFRVRYSLRGNGDAGKGQIEEIVRLRRTEDGLKIVGIRERKVGD